MGKERVEAFSDGVIAILITIMVLEMKNPEGGSVRDLVPIIPVFLSYVLSFLYLGIYWNNHHHMLHTVKTVTGGILWANLYLLFWLSLVPFVTHWMNTSHFARIPTAFYGGVLLMASLAYMVLQNTIIAAQGPGSILRKAIGKDWKGILSPIAYGVAILLAMVTWWAPLTIYFLVALIWLIPDRRIEKVMQDS